MSPCQNADDAKMSSYRNVLVPECPRFRNVQMPENLPAKSYTCQNGHGIKMFVPKCLAKIQGAKIIPSRKKLFAYGYPLKAWFFFKSHPIEIPTKFYIGDFPPVCSLALAYWRTSSQQSNRMQMEDLFKTKLRSFGD